jgi:hypothetical protein
MRSRLAFSTDASLRAQVRAISVPSTVTTTSSVVRSSVVHRRSTTERTTVLTWSTSASARNPT